MGEVLDPGCESRRIAHDVVLEVNRKVNEATRHDSFRSFDRRQAMIPELLPQRLLRQLARRRVVKLIDEQDVVGYPPLRDFSVVETQQVLARDGGTLAPDDEQQRTL